MRITKRTVPWATIIGGEIVLQGKAGVKYFVPDIGYIWVSRSELKANHQAPGCRQCALVTCADAPPEEQLWAILEYKDLDVTTAPTLV